MESAWRDMVVAKRAAEANMIVLPCELVFPWRVETVKDGVQGRLDSEVVICGRFEEAVSAFTVVISEVVDVDDQTRLVLAKHPMNIVFVVVEVGLCSEKLLEYARPVPQEGIFWLLVVE